MCVYFNRYDIVEAHYCFCADYHTGQSSPLYARMGRILRMYCPRPNLSYETLSENGRMIYERLATN